MNWVKDAVLDILILGVIIAYSITDNTVLQKILWVYTALLLVGKILYFSVGFLKQKASKTTVPTWFYHAIYILSIILLIFIQDYYLSFGWVIIWVLSTIPLLKKPTQAA